MEYTYKTYAKETDKIGGEHKIATISDLNLNINTTIWELNEIFLGIHDKLPEYIFLLGNMFPYYYLEDNNFKKNILHLLKLFTLISKVYVVFGETDYKLKNNTFIDERYLVDFYENNNISVLNNKIVTINGFSLIGYNRNPNLYSKFKSNNLREDILNFIDKINNLLNNDKYKIFLTNSHRDLLKLELDFFKNIDLIISGQLPNPKEMKKQRLLKRENTDHNLLETDGLTIIGNGGINVETEYSYNKGEIDLIRIKQKR